MSTEMHVLFRLLMSPVKTLCHCLVCFRLIRLTKRVRLGSLVNSVLMRGRSLVLGSERLEWEF